jgi:hypothetical protein
VGPRKIRKDYPGDLLVEIDGKALDAAGYDRSFKEIKRGAGSRVVLGVKHRGKVS